MLILQLQCSIVVTMFKRIEWMADLMRSKTKQGIGLDWLVGWIVDRFYNEVT